MQKQELIQAFNELGIADMAEVKELYELQGSFINLEYKLPSGQTMKFWDDGKMYYGAEVCKENSGRCYGLAAGDGYLVVSEYGNEGADAEIVVIKKL